MCLGPKGTWGLGRHVLSPERCILEAEMNDEAPSRAKEITNTIIIAVLVLIILGIGFVLFQPLPPAPKTPPPALTTTAPPPATGNDLGSELYQKAANPIGDKLPTTIAPVPNPIQSVYKNPFE